MVQIDGARDTNLQTSIPDITGCIKGMPRSTGMYFYSLSIVNDSNLPLGQFSITKGAARQYIDHLMTCPIPHMILITLSAFEAALHMHLPTASRYALSFGSIGITPHPTSSQTIMISGL